MTFQVKNRKKTRQAALQYAASRRALEDEDASKPFVWSEVGQVCNIVFIHALLMLCSNGVFGELVRP